MPDLSHLSDAQLLAIANGSPSAPLQGSVGRTADTDQQLQGAYANGRPMSWGEDAARSAVTGLERGVTSTLGLPGQIAHGVDAATRGAGGAISSAMGSTAGPLYDALLDAVLKRSPPQLPQTGAMDAGVQAVAGPYHQPQTGAGRFAETVGEMAPAAALPGGLITRGARVLAPALASHAAGETARAFAPNLEGPARFAGGIAGGLGVGMGEGIAAAPEQMIRRAAPNLSPADIRAAAALRQTGRDAGVNLTVPEGVQQATGGRTSLTRLQRMVENLNQTAPEMQSYFADRPGQVRGAVGDFVDGLAPPEAPGVTGMRAQSAAQGGLDSIRRGINAQAQPHYDALRGEEMGPIFQGALRGNPSYERALSSVRGSPELNGPIASLPDNNMTVVNDVVKQLDAEIAAAKQTAMNPSGNNHLAALRQATRSRADLLASLTSDNWRTARNIVSEGHRGLLDPIEAGPTGTIAGTTELPTQTGALLPSNPPLGQPEATSQAIGVLNGQDPQVAPSLVRQHMGQLFDQSTRDLTGGPNQYGGALYARALAGNQGQAQTLTSALDAIDPTQRSSTRLADLLEVLRATGTRERPNSMTAFNEADLNAMKKAPDVMRFIGGAGNPLKWGENFSTAVGARLFHRNLAVLADMLRDPDTAAVLERAAASKGPSAAMNVVVPAVTGGNR